MYGIIISGHGFFSEGIKSTIELVLGTQENMKFINFEGDCSSKELKSRFQKCIGEFKNTYGVIFLTDLKGGTPFNAAAELSLELENTIVFGGTNIPMVVSAIENRGDYDLDFISKEILENSKSEISFFNMNSTFNSISKITEDGI